MGDGSDPWAGFQLPRAEPPDSWNSPAVSSGVASSSSGPAGGSYGGPDPEWLRAAELLPPLPLEAGSSGPVGAACDPDPVWQLAAEVPAAAVSAGAPVSLENPSISSVWSLPALVESFPAPRSETPTADSGTTLDLLGGGEDPAPAPSAVAEPAILRVSVAITNQQIRCFEAWLRLYWGVFQLTGLADLPAFVHRWLRLLQRLEVSHYLCFLWCRLLAVGILELRLQRRRRVRVFFDRRVTRGIRRFQLDRLTPRQVALVGLWARFAYRYALLLATRRVEVW